MQGQSHLIKTINASHQSLSWMDWLRNKRIWSKTGWVELSLGTIAIVWDLVVCRLIWASICQVEEDEATWEVINLSNLWIRGSIKYGGAGLETEFQVQFKVDYNRKACGLEFARGQRAWNSTARSIVRGKLTQHSVSAKKVHRTRMIPLIKIQMITPVVQWDQRISKMKHRAVKTCNR